MSSPVIFLVIFALHFSSRGSVNGWPAGPPSARSGRFALLLESQKPIPCSFSQDPGYIADFERQSDHLQSSTSRLETESTLGCGGHGKCSPVKHQCECDPCWSGATCTQYVDLHQPRFLVNNLYRVVTRDVKGAVFRAEVTDDDLGLTCPLHGSGEAATCPCATVRFNLRPGDHASLFSVDNETGDVFLAPGVQLTPGSEYHLTLEAHGLRVVGWRGERPGHDVMRAVMYVSYEAPLETLLLAQGFEPRNTSHVKRQRRRKRQNGGGLSVELLRERQPSDSSLRLGDALLYKVVLRLPRGQSWSQQVTLEVSTEQRGTEAPVFSLCDVRISRVTAHTFRSSVGNLLALRPILQTHPDYSSMFVKAIFDMGIISMDDQAANVDNVGEDEASIEVTFEAVLSRLDETSSQLPAGVSYVPPDLQYISASLRNGEAGAQTAVNISTTRAAHRRQQLQYQQLNVGEETTASMTPNSPATVVWRVKPGLVSSDLSITVWDITSGPALFRVGGLSLSHLDDGFHCLAVPKAILTPIKCLLNNDLMPRLLAKIYIPVYTRRRAGFGDEASIEFTAWLIPFKEPKLMTNSNITIETTISCAGNEWRSKLNISLQEEARNDSKTMSFTSTPVITVTSLSTTIVPQRVPVLNEIALQLPKGIFNLTMTLTGVTKGIKPISLSIVEADSTIDQEALSNYKILRPSSRELIFQPTQFVFNSREGRIVVHSALTADGSSPGAGVALLSIAAMPQPVQLNMTLQPMQPMVVTPKISVVPYENEKAFDERGLLGFGILMEIPGGTCTKTIRVEVSGRYEGLGEAVLQLCGTSIGDATPGLPGLTTLGVDVTDAEAGVVSRDLGRLCAARMLNSKDDQKATYRVVYRLFSPNNSTLDGEIRMSGRVRLGGTALWSGGVAVRVHREPTSPRSESHVPSDCSSDEPHTFASRCHP